MSSIIYIRKINLKNNRRSSAAVLNGTFRVIFWERCDGPDLSVSMKRRILIVAGNSLYAPGILFARCVSNNGIEGNGYIM